MKTYAKKSLRTLGANSPSKVILHIDGLQVRAYSYLEALRGGEGGKKEQHSLRMTAASLNSRSPSWRPVTTSEVGWSQSETRRKAGTSN